MKNLLVILFFAVTAIVMFNACDKSGCTDPDSTNYDPNAVKDDGSCKYEGQVIFWYDNNTKMKLLNSGLITLNYFIDGYKKGTVAVTKYSATEPNCGQSGLLTVTFDMGTEKTLTKKFEVYDADNTSNLVFTGNINFKANNCVKIKLVK